MNKGLAKCLEESGWAWKEGMDRREAAYGSLALTVSPAAEAGKIASRVHPELLGSLADLYPDHCIYLDEFAKYVKSELAFHNSGNSRSFPRSLFSDTGGWDRLAAQHGNSLLEWTRPFVDGNSRNLPWFAVEQFPVISALNAADTIEPGCKARVIGRWLREMAASSFRSNDLYREATALIGPLGEEARQLALNEANNDAKLFEFAIGIQRSGQSDWLYAQIESDLSRDAAGLIARGLTLAGFLQPTEAGDIFWRDKLAHAPASGWLTRVHGATKNRYQRYRWSRHWSDLFQSTGSDDEAFAAFELFVSTVDERLFSGGDLPSRVEVESWSWRRQLHWSTGWDRVQAAAKLSKERLSKEFFSSKLPLSNQSPRLQ